MPRGQKKQNTKQKQYCKKLNKDFENGPHQNKRKMSKETVTKCNVGSCIGTACLIGGSVDCI